MTSKAISRLNVDDITQAIALRSAEAALGRLRLSNAPLREHLRTILTRPPGTSGSLIASPVLEAAFGYATAPQTLDDLSAEGLLHPASVAALGETTPLNAAEREGRNTLPSTTHPYEHQLAAWRALAHQPPRCIVVSSGTGSGKTEAFLVPILDALARQTEQGGSFGVQALLLYPLNALIASQRDRLADWTAPFEGRVRFCLYNGETPEQLPADKRRARPYEAVDREQLRSGFLLSRLKCQSQWRAAMSAKFRVVSVTAPSCTGTFRSTRRSTRFPLRSPAFSKVRNGIGAR